MKQLTLLLPLLGLPLLGAAQTGDQTRQTVNVFNSGFSPVVRNSDAVQGSPLLFAAWTPAQLLLTGSAQPVAAPVKYDVVRQELRVRRPAGDSVVATAAQVQEFALDGPPARRFVPLGGAPGGFAEVLSPGAHLQLLKRYEKVVGKAAASGAGYASTGVVNTYGDYSKCYLKGPDGRLTEVRPKRASPQEALAACPASLEARKGSLSSEAELRGAVAALDPLMGPP